MSQPQHIEQPGVGPLEILEYFSAAGAVAGTVATALTANAVFAAAPLSLSVLLNLANRRRADGLLHQQMVNSVEQTRQQVANDVQGLRRQMMQSPGSYEPGEPLDLSEIHQAIADLSRQIPPPLDPMVQERLHQLSEVDPGALRAELATLQGEYGALSSTVDQLNLQLRSGSPGGVSMEVLEQEVAQLRTEIAQLESARPVDPLANPFEVSQPQQELQVELQQISTSMQAQIAALEERLNTVAATASGGATAAVSSEQFHDVLNQLQGLHSRVDALTAMPAPQPQPEPAEIRPEFEAMLAPVQAQMATLEARIITQAEATPQVNPDQLRSLQAQVDSLGLRLDEAATRLAQDVATLQASLTQPAPMTATPVVIATPEPDFTNLDDLLASPPTPTAGNDDLADLDNLLADTDFTATSPTDDLGELDDLLADFDFDNRNNS